MLFGYANQTHPAPEQGGSVNSNIDFRRRMLQRCVRIICIECSLIDYQLQMPGGEFDKDRENKAMLFVVAGGGVQSHLSYS